MMRLQYVDTPRQVGIQLFMLRLFMTAILVIDVLRHRKNSVTDTAI